MELCVFTEPQRGATYAQLTRFAQAAEASGWDGFFRSDHYLAFTGDGLPGPTDAWTTLAGLARDTETLRLGTLVSPATFREPAVLALQVAQVDEMSGGRVELGLGAGWFEPEHTAFGLAFPAVPQRFDRFEEQLQIITGLWSVPAGETYSFTGAHHQVSGNPGLPRPLQRPVPVIIGGSGRTRTPRLAARFATEYNTGFGTVDEAGLHWDRARQACEAVGRDPATLALSYASPAIVGRSDAECARRAQAVGLDLEDLRRNGITGSPEQVIDRIGELGDRGAGRCYLQLLDLEDLDQVELIGSSVRPALAPTPDRPT